MVRAKAGLPGLVGFVERRISGLRESARIDTQHLRDKWISRLDGVFEVATACAARAEILGINYDTDHVSVDSHGFFVQKFQQKQNKWKKNQFWDKPARDASLLDRLEKTVEEAETFKKESEKQQFEGIRNHASSLGEKVESIEETFDRREETTRKAK